MIILDAKRYANRCGIDSIALTEVSDREIYLSPKGRSYETVVHEIVHAYYVELCLHSASQISKEDCEEIFSEFLGKFGQEALDLSEAILEEMENRKL